MARDRLILVAGNDCLGTAIQGSLTRELSYRVARYGFEAARDHLGPGDEVVVLLAPTSAPECAEAVGLVQEARLRQWPAAVVVIDGDDPSPAHDLARLDPFVAGRFSWPAHAGALFEYLKGRPGLAGRRGAAPEPDAPAQDWFAERFRLHTPSLMPLAERLTLAAEHDVTVLLTGETGTGKTHLARLIHENSPRRQQRLLVIPCGALAPSLVASEFFGHARGAFTGADHPAIGKFEAAGAGTILLDEVDALGLEQQATLLRVIETSEFEPVGSNDTRHCAARILAASNLDLQVAVARGTFREDLYYRLNVLALHLPPLRERVQDLAPLARGMAARLSKQFRKELFAISPEAVRALEAFPWPGNIRQLENALQQAVLVSTGPELRLEHLPAVVRNNLAPRMDPAGGPPGAPGPHALAARRDEQERQTIARALAEAGGCRSRAARALGVSRATLYNKLKKLGLVEEPRPWPRTSQAGGVS
jgi:two-component system response regulator HydG